MFPAHLIAETVVAAIHRGGPLPGNAKKFHDEVEDRLNALGWETRREVVVVDRGDGRRGKIDLVASRGDQTLAFEFDRKSPRRKSLLKLAAFACSARVVLLREPMTTRWVGNVLVHGVGAVV